MSLLNKHKAVLICSIIFVTGCCRTTLPPGPPRLDRLPPSRRNRENLRAPREPSFTGWQGELALSLKATSKPVPAARGGNFPPQICGGQVVHSAEQSSMQICIELHLTRDASPTRWPQSSQSGQVSGPARYRAATVRERTQPDTRDLGPLPSREAWSPPGSRSYG